MSPLTKQLRKDLIIVMRLMIVFAVFGIIAPILCSIVLLWAANRTIELHRVQIIIKFVMFMGAMYSFVIQQNLLLI